MLNLNSGAGDPSYVRLRVTLLLFHLLAGTYRECYATEREKTRSIHDANIKEVR